MKEKAQDPLAARSTSRPIFASVMGYRRSLVDTCKNSSVLVVSTLVAFMYLLCFCPQERLGTRLAAELTTWQLASYPVSLVESLAPADRGHTHYSTWS